MRSDIQEERCERYGKRHTSIRDFFRRSISALALLSFSVRSSCVSFFRRHFASYTIDELNLWIEMENHKKNPQSSMYEGESVWHNTPKCNEWTFLRSFDKKHIFFLGRTFFCERLMNVISNRQKERKKKQIKKDYLLLYSFFLAFLVCNDIRIVSYQCLVWKGKKINWNLVIESEIVIKNATRMTSHKNHFIFSRATFFISPINRTRVVCVCVFFGVIPFINMVHSMNKA